MQYYYGYSRTGCKGESLVEALKQTPASDKLKDRMEARCVYGAVGLV